MGTFENFGSYREVSIDFSEPGLSLVYGRTGSGKSTIPDMAFWTLFGETAKGGNADEVRSWQAEDELTKAQLDVLTSSGIITIVRARGSAKQNDLYWTEHEDGLDLDYQEKHRGKDLADTQKLLNTRLGINPDLYAIACYFHEFSATAQFFTAKAKDRRELFDKLAVLDLPIQLAHKASESRKTAKIDLEATRGGLKKLEGRLEALNASMEDSSTREDKWEEERDKRVAYLGHKAEHFETEVTGKIAQLERDSLQWETEKEQRLDFQLARCEALIPRIKDPRDLLCKHEAAKNALREASAAHCEACGGPDQEAYNAAAEKMNKITETMQESDYANIQLAREETQLDEIKATVNPYPRQIEAQKNLTNIYLDSLEETTYLINPFVELYIKHSEEFDAAANDYEALDKVKNDQEHRVASLTRLYDLSFELRGELLRKAVKEIESETNRYLETYFDGEIKVQFNVEGADNLQVAIQKSGYDCTYKQLSRGQRSLLRLCFCVSVMRAAANKAGVHMSNLFFDEVLDGLSEDLKVKAYGMFEELSKSHESIMIIDHATAFQSCFDRRYHVTLEGDASLIKAEHE